MEIFLRPGPVPLCNDDVTLEALRARRGGRQFTGFDAIGPVAELLHGALAPHTVSRGDHIVADLGRLDAPVPGRCRRVERAETRGNFARRLVSELMAGFAAISLHQFNPLALFLDAIRDAIPALACAGEIALWRNVEQGIPVGGRIILRRFLLARSDDRFQIQWLAGGGLNLRRIHQSVPAYPHGIVRFREVRKQIASLIVGHHNLTVSGAEVLWLRDHPNSRLRAFRTRDHAGDVSGIHRDRCGGFSSGMPRLETPSTTTTA